MPSAYTGDSSATQPPSDPPQAEGAITINLPADGDMDNASTFEQAFKVCGDFIAWLIAPFATGFGWIMAWRTALKHKRLLVDDYGFPRGAFQAKDQLWLMDFVGDGSNPSGPGDFMCGTYPEWRYVGVNAGSMVENALVPSPNCAALKLTADTGANGRVSMLSGHYCQFTDNSHIMLSMLAGADSATTDKDARYGMGQRIGSNDPIDMQEQCTFAVVGTEFVAFTRTGGAGPSTPTGINIPSAGLARLRIEWCGANVEQDGIRKVKFFIDGNLVATHTTGLPNGAKVDVFASVTGGDAGTRAFYFGPVQFRSSLFPDDVD